MGVKGLWQLLDSEGVLDDCEAEFSSLRGKILAVDVSIWLYHFVKSVPSDKDNAISPIVIGGLFQRVCKLLHFGIKPIFVFDGSAPSLKKETIAARQELKRKGDVDYTKLAKKILKNKLKLMALKEISDNPEIHTTEPKNEKETKVPPIDFLSFLESPEGSDEEYEFGSSIETIQDDYDIDTSSLEFKKLPYDIQEQILLVSRKRTIDSTQLSSDIPTDSRSNESPKQGDSALDFSKAQVEALIKRRKLMDELEMLRGNSVKTTNESKLISHGKIASSSEKKYIFTKNAQAGWTLSLTDKNSEEKQQEEDGFGISALVRPVKDKETEKSISEVEDDEEFMNLMFGDVDESVKVKEQPISPKTISEEKDLKLPIQLESATESVESESEFEISIPLKSDKEIVKVPDLIQQESEGEQIVLEQSHNLIAEDAIKLPEIILEGLIRTQQHEIISEDKEDKVLFNEPERISSSSEIEIDQDFKDFIEKVSETSNSTHPTDNFKELVDKLQNELREFNTLSEASALTSVSPTKVLLDSFMEMLHHFHIPFIIAPFEAEAQCANISGIDGVISDDSDCLLFGAPAVYKGFFGGATKGKKMGSGISVITLKKIAEITGLTRNDLIVLAHLLGCDYCTGITGIGPKRALELVRHVKCDDSIRALEKIIELSKTTESKYSTWLKDKIPNNFTDPRVTNAFLNPIITPISTNDMKWGSADRTRLERFMLINAKWSKEKTARYLEDIEKKNKNY